MLLAMFFYVSQLWRFGWRSHMAKRTDLDFLPILSLSGKWAVGSCLLGERPSRSCHLTAGRPCLDPLGPGASGTIWLLRSACSLTNLIFPDGYSIHVMLFCHLLLVTCAREHFQRDTVYFCVQHCAEISGFGLSGQNGLWCSFSLFTVHCKFN